MKQTQKQTTELTPTKRALLALNKLQTKLDALEQEKSEPIGIIGMGCRFPGGGNSPESFWGMLRDGVDTITELPNNRWDQSFFDLNQSTPGKIYCPYGGFLNQVDLFDPQFFGISPREAMSLDPQQRILLEVTHEALEHANQAPDQLFESRTGVFIGLISVDYAMSILPNPELVDAYFGTGNSYSVTAGRLSYILGLTGPCMTVDTSCSSALVALHLASQSLRTKECDMALVAGVNLILAPILSITFSKAGMLSPDGRCKTFDAAANGYVRGEGCGVVVLKRLSDAIANKDHIIAVVKGSAINQDGPSGGLTVPNGPSQEKVIREALKNAKIDPSQVNYIEAHGTGTSLGDPIELISLNNVFGNHHTKNNPLIVGSVKTNVGHMESAAGVVSLIKVLLSMQHEEIPPHLHFKTPNPLIPWDNIAIQVPTHRIPWPASQTSRIAGISSFGFSGTNVHVIVEDYQKPIDSHTQTLALQLTDPIQPLPPSFHLLCLSAKTEKALTDLASLYVTYLNDHPDLNWVDVCLSANTGRAHYMHRLCIIADSIDLAKHKLSAFLTQQMITGLWKGQTSESPLIAFLFSTQDAQSIDLGHDLYQSYPVFKQAIDTCHDILNNEWDISLREWITSKDETNHHKTWHQQSIYKLPALFAIEYALVQLLKSWGIKPTAVIGNQSGEIIAACVAGIFNLENGLKLMVKHARIDSSESSHTYDAMVSDYQAFVNSLSFQTPKINVISNQTGEFVASDIATPTYWLNMIKTHDHVSKGIDRLYQRGYRLLIDLNSMSDKIKIGQTYQDLKCLSALPSNSKVELSLFQCMAEIFVHGVTIDWVKFAADYKWQKVQLPTYPFQRKRYWIDSFFQKGIINDQKQSIQSSCHPLLGERLNLPFSKEIRFESHINANSPAHMKDHKVFGIVVMPAASHIALVLSGVKQAFESNTCVIENIVFYHALSFSDNDTRAVQLILTPNDHNGYDWQLVSHQTHNELKITDHKESWTQHSSGTVQIIDNSKPLQTIHVKAVQSNLTQTKTGTDFYKDMNNSGYDWGPSFQWIHQVWQSDNEALCKITQPQALPDDITPYQVYPGLLDACFQLLGSFGKAKINESGNTHESFIPFRMRTFTFFNLPQTDTLWCHVLLLESVSNQASLIGNLTIFDDTGNMIAEIKGFEFKAISQDTIVKGIQKNNNWFYDVVWQPKDAKTPDQIEPDQSGIWLIFSDQKGLGTELCNTFHKAQVQAISILPGQDYNASDNTHIYIHPKDMSHYQRLAQAFGDGVKGIVHLWSLNDINTFDTQATETSMQSLLHIVQAGWQKLPELWIITRDSQHVGENCNLSNVAQSQLWGMGQVIALEHPDFQTVRIDLDVQEDISHDAHVIWHDIQCKDQEPQIAWRNKTRYVSRLVKQALSMSHQTHIKDNCTYLITGGTGALGLKLAHHWVNKGAKYLVLLNRSGVTESLKPTIYALEKHGVAIQVFQGDVSDYEFLKHVFTTIQTTMPPLRGIVHAAGVLDDGVLAHQTWDRFNKVIEPKVKGAWYLHQLSMDKPLDFFICFSSIAALLGSPAQSNYAAANAFLDALAYHRKALGLPSLSINWGPWDQTGMVSTLTHRDQARWQSRGVNTIPPNKGLALFDQILGQDFARIGVFQINWSEFLKQFSNNPIPKFLEAFSHAYPNSAQPIQQKSNLIKHMEQLPAASRQKYMLNHIREMIAKIMVLSSPDDVDVQQSLFEIGMDSLMAVELRDTLETELGQGVRSTIVFDYPTPKALADYLVHSVLFDDSLDQTITSDETPHNSSLKQEDNLLGILSEIEQLSDDHLEAAIDNELNELLNWRK